MDATPLSVLRYLLEQASPYLPYPVRTALNLVLQFFNSLPPAVANVLPLLLTAFAIYTSIISLYSTARYTIRTTWWLIKWGTIIAVIAWAFGGGKNANGSRATGGNSLLGNLYNQYNHFSKANGPQSSGSGSGLGGFVQQAAASAGLGSSSQTPSGKQPLGILHSFIPEQYLRVVDSFSSYLDGSSSTSSARTKTASSSRRRPAAGLDDVDDGDVLGYTTGWLSSMAGKAWDAVNSNSDQDRWSESRKRRKATNQRTR